jgi:endonuclease-3 related protein
MDGESLRDVYRRLLEAYGPQGWWPGETAFEVMVGAILTQNTGWSNVERAIGNLRRAGLLGPEAIVACPLPKLAERLRPSGYFNIKAQRLQGYCAWYLEQGGLARLRRHPTESLREALLAVKGVGPETADDILLYAFRRPVFVIDAYTRRLFARLGCIGGEEPYEALRRRFERALRPDVSLYNEYHALIVRHAKLRCLKRPSCAACILKALCPAGEVDRAQAMAGHPRPSVGSG